MNDRQDDDLRAAFKALRRDATTTGPSFATLTSPTAMNAGRRRHRRRRIALAVAVLLPVAFILRPRPSSEPDFERFMALTGIDLAEVSWRAPSDVLLDVPGRNLLRRVPLIDITAPPGFPDSVRQADTNQTKRRTSS